MRAFLLGMALSLATVAPASAGFLDQLFAPKAKLWERWAAHDPSSKTPNDHTLWDDFLRRYVFESGDGISRAEQRAYWINITP